MGRRPCCAKEGLNRGAWSAREDELLINYIQVHGEGKWRDVPQKAGLMRCGKSCRLRWLNYLRPDIKRGNISLEEEDLIIRLHKLLGNRWSLIAGRLPGRTDNDIKNYWNTILSKKVGGNKNQSSKFKKVDCTASRDHPLKLNSAGANAVPHKVIRTKAVRCTKVFIPCPVELDKQKLDIVAEARQSSTVQEQDNSAGALPLDFDISELLISGDSNSGSGSLGSIHHKVAEDDYYGLKNLPCYPTDRPDICAHETKFEGVMDETVHEHSFGEILDLTSLENFLRSENEWINSV